MHWQRARMGGGWRIYHLPFPFERTSTPGIQPLLRFVSAHLITAVPPPPSFHPPFLPGGGGSRRAAKGEKKEGSNEWGGDERNGWVVCPLIKHDRPIRVDKKSFSSRVFHVKFPPKNLPYRRFVQPFRPWRVTLNKLGRKIYIGIYGRSKISLNFQLE